MLTRMFASQETDAQDTARGFDSFEVRLGDVMRGERATMGKSLMDVQRELRIRADYLDAIEHCDPDKFESKGFIAGYVRSYAKYLGLDPEWAFAAFCMESGFNGVHGAEGGRNAFTANSKAPTVEKKAKPSGTLLSGSASQHVKLQPKPKRLTGELSGIGAAQDEDTWHSFSAGFDLRLAASLLVALSLLGGAVYGGWTLVKAVQRVAVAPVEQEPVLMAELDPVGQNQRLNTAPEAADGATSAAQSVSPRDISSLYAYEVPLAPPVFTARDEPIANLSPSSVGVLAPSTAPSLVVSQPASENESILNTVETASDNTVKILALSPAWIRVRAEDDTLLFEGILDAGASYTVPKNVNASLHAGNSGSVFFQIGENTFGPAGPGTSVIRDLSVGSQTIAATFTTVDLTQNEALATVVASLQAQISE